MCWARQALWWFAHGYAPGLMVTNRYRPAESVMHPPPPVKPRSSPARPGEAGVQRRRVRVGPGPVAPGRVRLPDLDQGAGDGPAVAVEHPAGHDDPLADGLALVLGGQVGVGGDDPLPAQERAGHLG